MKKSQFLRKMSCHQLTICKISLCFSLLMAISYLNSACAKSLVKITSLGQSSQGGYVAIEEYGYLDQAASVPFSQIKIMSTIKKKVLANNKIKIVGSKKNDESLGDIRKKALAQAKKDFDDYKINFSI